MKTARIVVLTIAVGAGGTAAYPVDGSDSTLLPTNGINVVRDGVMGPDGVLGPAAAQT